MSNETVTISREEYDLLKAQNEQLIRQVEMLTEQIRLARKQRFGASSEQSKYDNSSEQMSFLFNEAEVYASAAVDGFKDAVDPDLSKVKEHQRKKRVNAAEKLPEDVEVEVVEKRLSESEQACPQCGEGMTEIGKEVIRRLKIVPAKFVVVETHIYRYACKQCDRSDITTPVRAAAEDKPVIGGSIATPEAIAWVMTQKYRMYTPLYRMEQQFRNSGIPLSRQTLSNWLLKATESWLEPVYRRLHEQLLREPILHADETTLQVLQEPGRKAQSKSYMWLYRTSREAKQPAVLYEYQETRNADHPKAFLQGYAGYLHTDGYAGYHNLPKGITVVGCWAHCRRKFDEALQALPEKDRAGSSAMRGKQYCDQLFSIEALLNELPAHERLEKRKELAEPVLEALRNWVFYLRAAPKSLLGKAAHYTREQWSWLSNYLLDGRLEISNNLAERSIKPFVMGRKNFLFANVPKGAKASAIIFSLIETAMETGLDPYRYLTWLLQTAPQLYAADVDWASRLLPACSPEHVRVRMAA